MRVEKRGKSSWRIQSMYKGKRYSITFDHKPSQKEITIALAAKYEGGGPEPRQGGTVGDFARKHIDAGRGRGLSPSTLASYAVMARIAPEWFRGMPLHDVEAMDVQRMIDECSSGRQRSTVAKVRTFYSAVFAAYRPSFRFQPELPRKGNKFRYDPSTSDVTRILAYAKGSGYSVFLQLAALGLRRGEIAALTPADLSDDDVLTISKGMVRDESGKWAVRDSPKTSASNRRILVPASLADEIRGGGRVCEGNPDSPRQYLHKAQDALGIPRFPLHRLRHFAAAYLNKMGFTRDQILEYCGWEKGSNVMERVYSYNLDPEESQKDIATAFSGVMP